MKSNQENHIIYNKFIVYSKITLVFTQYYVIKLENIFSLLKMFYFLHDKFKEKLKISEKNEKKKCYAGRVNKTPKNSFCVEEL